MSATVVVSVFTFTEGNALKKITVVVIIIIIRRRGRFVNSAETNFAYKYNDKLYNADVDKRGVGRG
jgi:hypothetical protein